MNAIEWAKEKIEDEELIEKLEEKDDLSDLSDLIDENPENKSILLAIEQNDSDEEINPEKDKDENQYFDIDWQKNDAGEWYIKSKDFVPRWLTDDIMNDYPIAKNIDLGKVYVWHNGHWSLNAKDIFENIAGDRLGDEFKDSRVRDSWQKANTQNLVRGEEWRSPSHKVNIQGGAYDYDKDEVVEKNPEDRFLHKIKYPYDPEAECPKFRELLEELLPEKEDRDKLLESLGLALLPDVHGKGLLFAGEGANGKTIILKIFDKILDGPNTIEMGIHNLEKGFDIDNLYGKIVMTDEDMSGSKLSEQNTSFFKKMVGGGKIGAEEKYGASYDFYPTTTPVFCANNIPPTPDRGKSFFRRWTIIKFPVTFSIDPDPDNPYEKEMKPESEILDPIQQNPSELRGILKLLIDKGVEAYNRDSQEVTGQRTWQEVKELWDEHSSPIYAFLKKAVAQGKHPDETDLNESYSADFVRKEDLFKLCQAYSKQRSNKRVTKNKIKNALENLDYYFDGRFRPQDNGERVMAYGGLKLKKYEIPENLHPLINEGSRQSVIEEKNDTPLRERIKEYVKDNADRDSKKISEVEDGMDEEGLVSESEIEKIEDVIEDLTSQGVVFEPEPGKIQAL